MSITSAGCLQMAAIFNLLQQHRLEAFYSKFLQLGVKDERDFLDGVTDQDLNDLGEVLKHVKHEPLVVFCDL